MSSSVGQDPLSIGDNNRVAIRVASVPATHVYVRHLSHPLFTRLKDPSGDDLRTPCFFDPVWIRRHSDLFDVLHINFGFEFYPTTQLTALCDVLAECQKGLVYTAHDLRNPNHVDRSKQDEALDVWMSFADEIVTLTPSAADDIRAKWGRAAHVIPHPHVIEIDHMRRLQGARVRHWDGFRIGIHFKSLRPNMVGEPMLRTALEAAQEDGFRLLVHIHHDVLDPASEHHDAELTNLILDSARTSTSVMDLHIHSYFADDELWNFMLSVDAVLLPYAFGTHSGFLEACRDLGTTVIAPSCGAYADQGAQHEFLSDELSGLDVSSLKAAMVAARRAGRYPALDPTDRATQQHEIGQAYYEIYRASAGLPTKQHLSMSGGGPR